MSTVNAVTRLKLFIEAASMVGGENWVPNPTQWAMIMNKIMELPEAPEFAQPPGPVYYPPHPHAAPVPYHPPATLFDAPFNGIPGHPGNPGHPEVSMVPPQVRPPDPNMGGGPSQLPIKLRVNPDGSVPESFS